MKIVISFLILFCFLLMTSNYAQLATEWTKSYGGVNNDEGYSVHQTADGGFIALGHTNSFGSGSSDIWLIKTNSNGDTMWTKTFGGNGAEYGGSVQETTDHGFIIAGNTYSYGAGGSDALLIKTNSSGDTLWIKTYGGPDDDGSTYAHQTSDGGFVICGTTNSYGAGNTDYWLIKTDMNGDTTWNRTYGGIYNDVAFYAQETSDNGYFIAGYTQPSGFSNSDIWLVKTNSNGDTTWTSSFGGNLNELPYSALQTSDGGYIITGYTYSYGPGGSDVWLIKTDSNGDSSWTRTFGGLSGEAGQSVIETSDNGFLVCGYTYSFSTQGDGDIWLIKTDSNGDSSWTMTVGGITSEIGFSIDQTSDDGYIVCGFIESSGTADKNVLLVKLVGGQTDIDHPEDLVSRLFELEQNFPNPFNPITKIGYYIPEYSKTTISVYDITGRKVKVLIDEFQSKGYHKIDFDASELSSGIYIYTLISGTRIQSQKMVLLR